MSFENVLECLFVGEGLLLGSEKTGTSKYRAKRMGDLFKKRGYFQINDFLT